MSKWFIILNFWEIKILTSWEVFRHGYKATILKMRGWVFGCGQQWLPKPSCPNSEDKCNAGPDWGQGVAWQGCHGDGAGLDREAMQNEAIVWPKWSTPHKEWHIQTVIQAYCCGWPAECCRSTVYPAGSTTHHKESARSENMKLWPQQEQQEQYWTEEPFPHKHFKDFLGHIIDVNITGLEVWLVALALTH